MNVPLAHAQDWLEPLLFAPAFAVVLFAIFKERRERQRQQAAGTPTEPRNAR